MPRGPWAVGSNQYQKRPGKGLVENNESTLELEPEVDQIRQPSNYSPDLVEARNTLLVVLQSLEPHRDALVLIGAQAVHERTKGLVDVISTATSDADIGVDPALLATGPDLFEAMLAAGFERASNDRPGIYSLGGALNKEGRPLPPSIDLIAPEASAGKGSRAATLSGHRRGSVSRANGIEMAMLDKDVFDLGPIGQEDGPTIRVNVAGTGALLAAKAWKLSDRLADAAAGKGHRVRPKDAGDVWRLMATSDPAHVRETFDRCARDGLYGASVEQGWRFLVDQFGSGGRGVGLAVRSMDTEVDRESVTETIGNWIEAFVRP